jgi:nitrogen regulatory protein P-II 1
MKLIISVIRPEKITDVKKSLWDIDAKMMTVIDVKGCGQQQGNMEEYRGIIEEVNLLRKVMIIIAVNESFVNKTVDAIVKGARTSSGSVGDGKIFVLDLEDCVRIRTKEKGVIAIGGNSEEIKKIKKK